MQVDMDTVLIPALDEVIRGFCILVPALDIYEVIRGSWLYVYILCCGSNSSGEISGPLVASCKMIDLGDAWLITDFCLVI